MAVDVYSFFVNCGNTCLVLDRDRGLAVIIDAGYGDTLVLKNGNSFFAQQEIGRYSADIAWVIQAVQMLCLGFAKILIVLTHPHKDHYNLLTRIISGFEPESQMFFVMGGTDSRLDRNMYYYPGHISKSRLPVGDYPYYTIVDFNEYISLIWSRNAAAINDLNPIFDVNSQFFQQALVNFCGANCISFRRTGGKTSHVHGKNIMVKYLTSGQNILVFMGDAIWDNNTSPAILAELRRNIISWYQIPHHGSSTDYSNIWTENLNDVSEYAVLSSLYGKYNGIPYAPLIERVCTTRPNPPGDLICADSGDSSIIGFNTIPFLQGYINIPVYRTPFERFLHNLRQLYVVGVFPAQLPLKSTQTEARLIFQNSIPPAPSDSNIQGYVHYAFN